MWHKRIAGICVIVLITTLVGSALSWTDEKLSIKQRSMNHPQILGLTEFKVINPEVGQIVPVPVTTELFATFNNTEVNIAELIITYDPTVWTASGVTTEEDIIGLNQHIDASAGRVTIDVASVAGIAFGPEQILSKVLFIIESLDKKTTNVYISPETTYGLPNAFDYENSSSRLNVSFATTSTPTAPTSQIQEEIPTTQVADLNMVQFGNKLYQFASVGAPDYGINYRFSEDGIFDGSVPSENWQGLPIGGKSFGAVSLAASSDSLYLAVRGEGDSIQTSSLDLEGNWTNWHSYNGRTLDSVAMTIQPQGEVETVHQAVRGIKNKIYVRSSQDLVFDGSSPGESWKRIDGTTPSAPNLTTFDSKIVLAVQGRDSRVYTRATADGEFSKDDPAEKFSATAGKTKSKVEMTVHQNQLVQLVRGKDNDSIYKRTSPDGVNWGIWQRTGITQKVGKGTITATSFDGKLYISALTKESTLITKSE